MCTEARKRTNNKYNAKAYKNISVRLRPVLYQELEDLKSELGLSTAELLHKLIQSYKQTHSVHPLDIQKKGEKTMQSQNTIKTIEENLESGVWVAARNLLAEKRKGEFLNSSELISNTKLILTEPGDLYLFSIREKLPEMVLYTPGNFEFVDRDGVPTLVLYGSPLAYDYYSPIDEVDPPEKYLKRFYRNGNLTPTELEEYSTEVSKGSLPVLNIEMVAEQKVEDTGSVHVVGIHSPLIESMFSPEGHWVLVEELGKSSQATGKDSEKLLMIRSSKPFNIFNFLIFDHDQVTLEQHSGDHLFMEDAGGAFLLDRRKDPFFTLTTRVPSGLVADTPEFQEYRDLLAHAGVTPEELVVPDRTTLVSGFLR